MQTWLAYLVLPLHQSSYKMPCKPVFEHETNCIFRSKRLYIAPGHSKTRKFCQSRFWGNTAGSWHEMSVFLYLSSRSDSHAIRALFHAVSWHEMSVFLRLSSTSDSHAIRALFHAVALFQQEQCCFLTISK